jgi:PAS domain S-box-containing protein
MAHGLQDVDTLLLDSLVVPASLHDVHGMYVHMNAAAERASGFSSAQMKGRHVTYMLPPEARDKVEALFRRAVEHGEPTDFETVFEDAGGHLRGTRAQHLPLSRGDTIVGVLILAFDVHLQPTAPVPFEHDPRLTTRQRETLSLLAAGLSTAEVARRLTLSPETVRNHLRNASRALQAHTRLEAIASAQRLGLLAAPALRPHAPDANPPWQ